MTVACDEINLQGKHNLICHVAIVKELQRQCIHGWHNTFFSLFNILFESNALIKRKKIYFAYNKEKQHL